MIRLLLLLAILVPIAAPAEAAPKAAEADANRLLNRALQELARYELEAGVATLGEVLARTPNDGFAHSRLAEVLAVGHGRGAESVAVYKALAAARPDERIRRVWVVRAEVARHTEDKWVVRGRPWVAAALEALEELTTDDDPEVRYAAWIALRDLQLRLSDGPASHEAGARAAELFGDRLQARVSILIQARDRGDAEAFRRTCARIIRDTPGAVEACALIFSGTYWQDADALIETRNAILKDVEKLGRRVLGDPVLAHEVAKFYGRPGVSRDLQPAYVERILTRHPDFRLSPETRWWRGRPPPLETTRRRIREAAQEALDAVPDDPRDAPWVLEESAARAAADGRHEDALRLIREARDALADLPYSPSATRPAATFHAWSQARARDDGRMLAAEARVLRALGRGDEAWIAARRAAWQHDDGRTWIELAQFAAARGEAALAVEADLEGLSRLDGPALAALPMEYRDRAVTRFLAAHPGVEPDLGWATLLSAAGARRADRAPARGGEAAPRRELHPFVGRPAPVLNLTTLSGAEISPETLRDKVVVVDFWATWCGPCKRAMPELQQARDELGDDVVILALSVDAQREQAEQFVESSGYTFEFAHVGPDAQQPWQVRGIPSTFVIDRGGVIRHHHQGYSRGAGLRIQEEVRALLAR